MIEAAQCYDQHVIMPISVTKNISKPISKVQTEAFITENNYNFQVSIRIINNVTAVFINPMQQVMINR